MCRKQNEIKKKKTKIIIRNFNVYLYYFEKSLQRYSKAPAVLNKFQI